MVLSIFFGVILYHNLTYRDINLKFEDSLDLYCESPKLEKGEIVINDSVVIQGNTRQIFELDPYILKERTSPFYKSRNYRYIPTLYDLDGPYRIIKRAYNDTIIVIKNNDTLHFYFLDIEREH